ncbi:decarboxylase [Amycolatopsis sp. SID8362]|uniref:maleate cis-trans isomerase family protein n=1 Tax=Amycolatopsis sp. SID8362 TaxID=2690346 RepID=UPI00136BE6E7|nr:decarboxylase [Amycolatopsis sp. SID8362]NBH10892.1 decarboxylase [Amycolatopsis sp. SID8362]NED47584.1 decarboxylase [Amycolatopsis sp. SID8362]
MDLGLLYPTRDRGEADFAELCRRLDPALGLTFAYPEWGEAVDPAAAVREIGAPERLTRAADQFPATPDVVSWACSSCSFTRGLDGARAQARALTGRLGVPASSTSLAYLAALERLDVDRVALASVYRSDLTADFAAFLAEAGVTTVHAVSADAGSDRALAAWGPARIFELAEAAGHEDAQVVLVPETALHTTPVLAELETRLGKPVLTATAVTVWDALDRLGEEPVQDGLGTLFRSAAGRRRPSSSSS